MTCKWDLVFSGLVFVVCLCVYFSVYVYQCLSLNPSCTSWSPSSSGALAWLCLLLKPSACILSSAVACVPSFTISSCLQNSRKALFIHQALSGSNTSERVHIGSRCQPRQRSYAPTLAHVCTYTCRHPHKHAHTLKSHTFSSCHSSLVTFLSLCFTCKWAKCVHAAALPLCVPNLLATYSLS